MGVKLSALKTCADTLAQGEWTEELMRFGGLKLRLRPTMNADWQKQLFEAGPSDGDGEASPDKIAEEERIWAMIRDTCITDWNVTDDDGNPVQYAADSDLIADLLNHPEFRSAVRLELIVMDAKARKASENAAKN